MILMLILAGAAAVTPSFDAIRFFQGKTRGDGSFKSVLHAREDVHVDGSGKVEPDGTLILDQQVRRGAKPAEQRQWRLRETSPGHYSGTLSDARGPVEGDAVGNKLHLRFTSKSGYRVEQWLVLGTGGQQARNHLVARRFGIVVATLDETIIKTD
jgi:hypothetical protein